MSNLAEHALFNCQHTEQAEIDTDVSCFECTNCFNISTQCLISVCPHCGEALKERNLRPSELLDMQENHRSRSVSKDDGTVFYDDSKLA
ncbi:hypothetical protein [Pseudoalteromonas piratica]|jgi:hypothetical protein|uniref:Uncharacterized protein n=1 Tax=Pseudoalteromonas piratica TaxID=1348114 RepID=A0A0A7EGC7_9GAMM|nr:hypothetical protein [Pseudoalteromonas piratica]AIY65664.1 hypothetical protein OM33_11245 [Pseudoalteromonas piratica]